MSKPFNFDEEQNAVGERAEKEFYETHDFDRENISREDRNKLRAFVRVAEREWFKTLEPFASIVVRPSQNRCEIEDRWFGGSITVYRPSREYVYSDERNEGEPKYRVAPGYMNASSWQAGNSSASARTSQSVAQELRNRFRMMEIATELLNEYNQVIVDWEDADNPVRRAQHLAEEVARMRENERQRFEAEQAKREARKAKK